MAKLTQRKMAEHIVVTALAGTGKTTTAVCGIVNLFGGEAGIEPSDEQAAVWAAMAAEVPNSVAMLAYNKAIATELQKRLANVYLPDGKTAVASTFHAIGLKMVSMHFKKRLQVEGRRTLYLLEKITGEDCWELRKRRPEFVDSVETLVSLCKQTLTNADDAQAMDDLCGWYAVPVNGDRDEVYEMVRKVLDVSKRPDVEDGRIDFDDMIWLPVVLDIPAGRNAVDLLIVDESQDLNRARQELAIKLGRRIMLIGDKNQAVYGFAGADAKSMARMTEYLATTARGVVVLPLTETRRCGKAIVAAAQRYVPEFKAHESNPDGSVGKASMTELIERLQDVYGEGQAAAGNADMILCRTNAPLTSLAFWLIRNKIRCFIQGRDLGKGLISLVKKSKAKTVPAFLEWLESWREKEYQKLMARKASETQCQLLADRCECLVSFAAEAETVEGIIASIEAIFADDGVGKVRLSSCHRSKGLEADNVWIYRPDLLPLRFVMEKGQDWEKEQERNLCYVAETRAIHNHRTLYGEVE